MQNKYPQGQGNIEKSAEKDSDVKGTDDSERLARQPMARPLTEETFKEMWMLGYRMHLGQITFLELLDKYEEILGIKTPRRLRSEKQQRGAE